MRGAAAYPAQHCLFLTAGAGGGGDGSAGGVPSKVGAHRSGGVNGQHPQMHSMQEGGENTAWQEQSGAKSAICVLG